MVVSNGNFHGEYPGKVLDYLAIAVNELAQISERRLERLLNSGFNTINYSILVYSHLIFQIL